MIVIKIKTKSYLIVSTPERRAIFVKQTNLAATLSAIQVRIESIDWPASDLLEAHAINLRSKSTKHLAAFFKKKVNFETKDGIKMPKI